MELPSRPRFRLSWSFILTALLSLVLLILAFRGADWGDMLNTVRQGRVEYLLVALLTTTLAYLLRALRWWVLLNAERPLHWLTAFWGTNAGYLGNLFLPARAGELIRTALIARRTGINVLYVLATALTERIFDAALLVLIVILLLPTLAGVPDWVLSARQGMLVLGIGGFAGLLIAPRLEGLIRAVLNRLPLPQNIRSKLGDFIEKFLLGLRALQHPGRAALFTIITLLVWATDVVLGQQLAAAFDITLNWQQILFLLAALGLSSAIPSTPGYIGVYQFVTVTVLEPFGISQNQALVYILAYQLVTYVIVILWGLIGLWRLNIRDQQISVPANQPDSQTDRLAD